MIDFIQANPRIGIIAISVAVSFFISLVNYFVLDKQKMREMKDKQKKLNEEMKANRGNPEKIMELNKELLSHTMETFKHSFKPILITIIPILIVFNWIKEIFAETTIASSWFWWYLISAIISSLIFRKIFKLP